MSNIVIKNISEITPYETTSTLTRAEKQNLVSRYINPTKYNFCGFVDRTNEAILEARYYNVRDSKGRFARIRQSR